MDEFAFQPDRVKKLKEKYGDNLYQVKREAKYRYVYILADKRLKNKIMSKKLFEIKPYPKGENKKYDASYQPSIQTQLF
jgi:hypothetical protein